MAGVFAHSTILNVTYGETPTLSPIAELTSITGVEISVDEIDVSSHDSVDAFREFEAGMKDAGSVSIEGNYIGDASQKALYDLAVSGSTVAMSIVFPGSTGSWTFDGFVTSLSTDAPMDDKISFSATIKVTGKPILS
jgi:predicted secreted protein